MIKSLPYLEHLSLVGVKGHEWRLVDEEYPCLKYLLIYDCYDLIHWKANSSHFPVLKYLRFGGVFGRSNLSGITSDIGDIPTLESITLIDCSVSSALSAMRILVEQERNGSEDLHLRVFFKTSEETDIFRRMLQEQDLQSKNLHL